MRRYAFQKSVLGMHVQKSSLGIFQKHDDLQLVLDCSLCS